MELAIQIEDAAMEAEILGSMLLAVQEAIYNGDCHYTEYELAFHAVFRMMEDHKNHLKELTDKAYALQRGENKKSFERQQEGNNNVKSDINCGS